MSSVRLNEFCDAIHFLDVWERTSSHYMTSRSEATQENVGRGRGEGGQNLWRVMWKLVNDFQRAGLDLETQEFLVCFKFKDNWSLVEVLVEEDVESRLSVKLFLAEDEAIVNVA